MVIVLQSETYEPVLLRKRADRVKRELGHSNVRYRDELRLNAKELFLLSITRPLKLLFLNPSVALFSLYTGTVQVAAIDTERSLTNSYRCNVRLSLSPVYYSDPGV
jgi:hypothetical protein